MDKMKSRDESRGIETLVLVLYAFYTFLICFAIEYIGINKYNMLIAVCAWIICFVIYITKYINYRTRAFITTVLMEIAIVLYALGLDDIDNAIPLFMVSMVLVQIYGIAETMFVMYASFVIILSYHMAISQTVPLNTNRDVIHIAFLTLNVFVMISIIYMLLKKRQSSTSNITKIITELKEAERSKDLFLANVSHEIRTPVNTICGLSEMALREDNYNKLKGEIYSIQSAGRSLMSIVSDILDFSELQDGNVVLEEEEYNITSTINDVINTIIARKMERPIELIVDCDTDLPCMLRGDEKKIRRVIMNLVNNAFKFTNDGGIALDFFCEKQDDTFNLIINVRDTGIGISEDDLEKLFVGFSQADDSISRKNTGLGLGLAISKILVDAMGGRIAVKSKEGKGTTMSVVIPQKVIDDKPIIHLDKPDEINAAIYINMEKFNFSQVRDEYDNLIKHMIGDLKVKAHICRSLVDLRAKLKNEELSHVFISYTEYCEDKRFFNRIAEGIVVVVFVEQSQFNAIDNDDIHIMLKPVYVLPVCEVLNGINSIGNVETRMHNKKFIAPDAKILVVDDNKMNLAVIEGLLEQYKIQVTQATSGSEALDKITSMDYDFVFMDHMMPGMDGVETVKRIREKKEGYYHNVPIIALTANAIAGVREYFLARGFTDFLEKPVEMSVLERVLKRNIPLEKQIPLENEDKKSNKTVYDDQNDELDINTSQNGTLPENDNKAIGTEKPKQTKQQSKQTVQNAASKNDKPGQKETDYIDLSINVSLDVADNNDGLDFLDTEKGMSYCGSKEMYYDILKTCYEDSHQNIIDMNDMFDDANWKDYIILVHALKGTMKTIGAGELSDEAKKLEAAGKEGDIRYITDNHAEVMRKYGQLMEKIANVKALNIKKDGPLTENLKDLDELSDETAQNLLQSFEDAVYGFDESRMLKILDELEGLKYRDCALSPKLTAIRGKVEKSDYMSAHRSLAELLTQSEKSPASK